MGSYGETRRKNLWLLPIYAAHQPDTFQRAVIIEPTAKFTMLALLPVSLSLKHNQKYRHDNY
jgi:hypothetical protein